MGTGTRRGTALTWAATLAAAAAAALAATPAQAAPAQAAPAQAVPARATPAPSTPACTGTPPAGRDIADMPWAQQRYAPDRLTGLADGSGITVAVIDSGIDPDHPQLRHHVLAGEDLLAGGSVQRDCVGHGTAVASIIAGQPQPGIGFHGLAPGASVLPVRLTEQEVVEGTATGRAGTAKDFATAIRHAVAAHAKVLNLSVVLPRDDPAVRDAVGYAVAHDVVVVAAAGNAHDRGDPVPYPAAYDGVLGVGAIGPDGQRWPGSQVGPYVDLVAPGSEVTAATVGGGCAVGFQGTSFAVPFVAAAAALVWQYRPALSAGEVVARLLATADPAPAGPDTVGYGHGVLNPYRAVTEPVPAGAAPLKAPAAPLKAAATNPASAAAAAANRRARDAALTTAGAGLLLAGLVALATSALTRGRRRRWRPGDRLPASDRWPAGELDATAEVVD